MAVILKDIILQHIEQALDIDDLETFGDYVWSIITTEALTTPQLEEALCQLHSDIAEACETEKLQYKRAKLKAALQTLEVDFYEYFVGM